MVSQIKIFVSHKGDILSSPKEFLTKLYNNLQLLQEREANYGSFTAPLWLINQIEHYQKAIDLTEQAIEQNISAEGLQTEFTSLNLEIRDTIEFKSARKPYDGRNPYRGLEKFTEHDCEFFFGRAAVTAELVAMTQALLDKETSGKNPALLSIIGASGSGKSSLVQAGLIPALREGHIPNSETWPIRVIFPGPKPIEAWQRPLSSSPGAECGASSTICIAMSKGCITSSKKPWPAKRKRPILPW